MFRFFGIYPGPAGAPPARRWLMFAAFLIIRAASSTVTAIRGSGKWTLPSTTTEILHVVQNDDFGREVFVGLLQILWNCAFFSHLGLSRLARPPLATARVLHGAKARLRFRDHSAALELMQAFFFESCQRTLTDGSLLVSEPASALLYFFEPLPAPQHQERSRPC